MAVDIIKQLNGNVGIYDTGTGNFIVGFEPEIFEIECTVASVVRILQKSGEYFHLDPSIVSNTQVLPAAAVPFAGTCASLSALLLKDFFFVVSSDTGGSVYEYPSQSTQHFLQSNVTSITTIAGVVNVLRGYYITIEKDISIDRLSINVSTGVAGNSVFGVYDLDANSYPNNLIVSTGVNDNSVTGLQNTAVSQTLTAGNYFACYNSSSAATFRALTASDLTNTANPNGVMSGTSPLSGLTVAYVYTGTLPATFPVGATTVAGNIPYLIFRIA